MPTTDDLVFTRQDAADGFRISNVLLFENAGGEATRVVGGKDGDRPLQDDHTVVQLLVDKVNRAAGHLDAVVEGLGLRVEPRKSRQQRRMNIQDALRKSLNK